jgi:hypothetical protein
MSRSTVVVLLALVAAGCRAAEAELDAGSHASSADAADATDPWLEDGGFLDASPTKPTPDAIAPPVVACGADAEAGACAIPGSFCLDDLWLEYFESKGCVDGTCSYEAKMLSCKGYCADGGCVSKQLTAPTPQ